MAIYSTGISVSFNGNAFSEVTGISWSFGGGISEARSVVWRPYPGQISIQLIGGATTAFYGIRGLLVITGGGVNLRCFAVCTSVNVEAQLNGLSQYTYEFEIIDS